MVNGKLSPKFFGPCKVVERTGVLAYKSIHLVVHVSQLKKALGPFNKPSAPVLSDMFEWVTELADVPGYRKNPSTKYWEVVLAWKERVVRV